MKQAIKYLVCIGIGAKESMEYRANYLIGLISCILPIVIQCFLWTAIFISSQKTTMYGYSYNQLILYSLLAGLISRLVEAGFHYEMANDIKTGSLNKFMVQPVDYFFYRATCFFGQKSQHFIIILTLIAGVLVFCTRYMDVSIYFTNMIVFIIALILGILLNFTIFFCIGTLAFWFSQIAGFFGTFILLSTIISGGVFPLDVFGDKLNAIFKLLPFQYTVFFQIGVINGKIGQTAMGKGIFIQILWIIVFALLSKLLWYKGLKKYIAIGG